MLKVLIEIMLKLIFILTCCFQSLHSRHLNSAVISTSPIKSYSNGTIDVEFTVKIAYTRSWSLALGKSR